MKRALLTFAALAAFPSAAHAEHQRGNLRGATAADLCPPISYVYVDDREDEALAVEVDERLARYATLYGLPFGDPRTCTVTQIFTLDLSVELSGDAHVSLGSRTLTVSHLQLWSVSGYGSTQSVDALADLATESVRDSYEELALGWKATHSR